MITRNPISSSVCLQVRKKPQILDEKVSGESARASESPAIYRLGPIVCMSGRLAAALAAYCQEIRSAAELPVRG